MGGPEPRPPGAPPSAEASWREDVGADPELLTSIVALAPTGIAILEGPRHRYLLVNEAYHRLARGKGPLTGRAFAEVWPEAGPEIVAVLDEVFRTGARYQAKEQAFQVERDRGPETIWVSYSFQPMRGEGGAVARVLVMVNEVTEAKRTELALRESEERLREAHLRLRRHVENTPLALVEWDGDYRVRGYSARAQEVFGYAQEEVLGKRIDEIPWVPESDWPSVRAVMHDLFTAERPTNVNANRNLRKDGALIDCEWYNSALYDAGGRLTSILSLVLDVTDRVRAGAERDRLAAQRQLALDAAEMGWWQLDPATRVFSCDARCAEILGLTAGERPQEEVLKLLHPQDLPRVWAAIQAAIDPGRAQPYAVEYRILRPDGALRWVEAHGRAAFEGEGEGAGRRPGGLVGTIADVTARKLSEAAREESEARLRLALESGRMGTFEIDLQRDLVTASAGSDRIFGLSRPAGAAGPLPMADYFARVHPQDLPRVAEAIRTAVEQGREHEVEYRVVHPGGEVRWIHSRGEVAWEGGAPARLRGAISDVTEAARTREELQRSEQRLRALADSIPQLAWIAAPDGAIVWYNRRWYEYTGTTPAQMAGWGWRQVHDPAVLPEVLRRWKEAVAAGTPFDMEFPLRGADGRFRRFLTRVIPLKDGAGRVVQWFGTNTDVDELVAAREALAESDRRKTEFLAVLSHELRNPLAPIRNALHLTERAPPGSDVDQRARAVLRRQVEHLARLVDDLLDVARVSRGKIDLQRTVIDATGVVLRACDDLRPAFEQRGVGLRAVHGDGPAWVDADPARLAQMVGNLLQNALKFTGRGGRVEAEVEPRAGRCLISVRDTGVGIAPEDLPGLFVPFAQAERTRGRSQGGLGLGLSLVRELARLHGGSARASSPGVGHGSAFVIELPLAPAPATPVTRPAGAAATERLSILVVEDNEDARATLADVLALMGHDARLVGTGRAALEEVARAAPEALVCDLGLPDMSGHDVIRAVRASPGGEAVFAIALTGYAQPQDREEALLAGFDRHLAKPPALDELDRLLAEAARRRGGRPAAP